MLDESSITNRKSTASQPPCTGASGIGKSKIGPSQQSVVGMSSVSEVESLLSLSLLSLPLPLSSSPLPLLASTSSAASSFGPDVASPHPTERPSRPARTARTLRQTMTTGYQSASRRGEPVALGPNSDYFQPMSGVRVSENFVP